MQALLAPVEGYLLRNPIPIILATMESLLVTFTSFLRRKMQPRVPNGGFRAYRV